MPLNIRSETVNQLAEALAARKRTNKTEAVRLALEDELRRLGEAVPPRAVLPAPEARPEPPRDRPPGRKAFYDELSSGG